WILDCQVSVVTTHLALTRQVSSDSRCTDTKLHLPAVVSAACLLIRVGVTQDPVSRRQLPMSGVSARVGAGGNLGEGASVVVPGGEEERLSTPPTRNKTSTAAAPM